LFLALDLDYTGTLLSFIAISLNLTLTGVDIKGSKIWIQHNMTEADIGQELVEKGVPSSDIVLGLRPPYKRPYTNYGVT
jgi:hypothetical protein